MVALRGHDVEIPSASAPALAYEVRGPGEGELPGVLMLVDGLGLRDALRQMADRFAAAGYHVIVPDLFHSLGRGLHFDPKVVFASPEGMADLRKRVGGLDTKALADDLGVFLEHLATRPGVDRARRGVVGYCMGGRLAFVAATRYPDALRAMASIHGGGLVTAAPESPHTLADRAKARLYFGIAEQDNSFTPENEATLRDALTKAGADFEMDHYAARHGWAVLDTPVYVEAEAERHVERVLSLFEKTLRR